MAFRFTKKSQYYLGDSDVVYLYLKSIYQGTNVTHRVYAIKNSDPSLDPEEPRLAARK